MRCALALAALAACGGGTHLGFDAGTDDGPVAVADAHADSATNGAIDATPDAAIDASTDTQLRFVLPMTTATPPTMARAT